MTNDQDITKGNVMTTLTGQDSACITETAHTISLRAKLSAIIAVRRQRRALRNLDDRLLCDIGVSNREAAREIARPLWDVPSIWRK